MFGFTDDAAALIRLLIDNHGLDSGTGLRMSINPIQGSLVMSLTTSPDTTDEVFTHHDVRVFVDPAAQTRLHTQTLDARHRPPAFFLLTRP